MKLAELIQEHHHIMAAETALKNMDWSFDVDPFQVKRFEQGTRAMAEVEKLLGVVYRTAPDVAHLLWEENCPYAQTGLLPKAVLNK